MHGGQVCIMCGLEWCCLPRFDGRKDCPLFLVTLADFFLGSRRATKIQGTLFHGVLREGKVARNCVQLGKLEWPLRAFGRCLFVVLWGKIQP